MVISSRKKLLVAEAVQKAATTLLKPSSRQSTSNVSRKKARVYHAPAIPRTRRSVQDIYNCLGPLYFRRAYRMTYDSFCRLHDKLQEKILEKIRIVGTKKIERLHCSKKHEQQKQKRLLNLSSFSSPKQGNFKKKRQQQKGNYKPPPVHNGIISTSVRLACALRYFAGGSAYDLMAKYGISHSSVLESVWYVVDAINSLEEFFIEYPSDHSIQQKIADDFRSASGVDFANCVGAVDGILIWIHKPSKVDSEKSGIGMKKLFCGRKKKFGLNCQAVSDKRGRFLDMSIQYGGSTADCIAFEASDIYSRLNNSLLLPGGVLFGDNAYLNSEFMATPYPNVSGGSRDNYNFYHSQVSVWGKKGGRSILWLTVPTQLVVACQQSFGFPNAICRPVCHDDVGKQP